MDTHIISYNVGGLQTSDLKRNKIFHYLKQNKVKIAIDIVYSATCLHVTLYMYTYTIKYVTHDIS